MKFNGHIDLNSDATGYLRYAYIEQATTTVRDSGTGNFAPATLNAGRLIFNTTTNTYQYYGNDTAWHDFATGGDATAVQTEVDAIETASGGVFGTDGTYGATAVNGALANVTGSTDLLDALTQLDSAITAAAGVDTLGELTDVTITAAATGDMLVYTGAAWEDQTPAEVRTNLSLVPGTDVQAYDLALDNLSALAGTGIVVQTAADTFTVRSIVESTTNALTITNGDGVAGNPSIAIDADLDTIAGLAHTGGEVIYSNAGTWAAAAPGSTSGVQAWDAGLDSIAGLAASADDFIIANGTDNYTTFAAGTFGKTLLGEATAADARTSLDVYSTGDADAAFVNITGDTMTGNLIMSTGATVTGLPDPTGSTDAANKAYVDAVASGVAIKPAVRAATVGDLATTTGVGVVYDNGTSGVGATLTIGSTGVGLGLATLDIDGVTAWALNDGILIKDQTSALENGRYYVSTIGDADNAWVLTRCGYCDESSEIPSSFIFVQEGTTNTATGWAALVGDPATFTVGTDDITWVQFSGAGSYTAGTGLALSGTVFNVNLGAGIKELPTDEVGVDVYSGGGLITTLDGSTTSTLAGAQLAILLDGSSLSLSGSGLTVATDGVTAAHINADIAGDGIIQNAGDGRLDIELATGSGLELTATDGSGQLQIAAGGVTNAMLANSSVTMSDGTNTDAVVLGETFTITGGTNITSTVGANEVTIDWSASIDDLTDVDTTTAAPNSGDALVWDGTNWVPGNPVNSTSELSDVTAAASATGQVLVADGANDYTPRLIHYVETTSVANTSHTITHNLGQKFVNVTIADTSDEVIIPQSITFTDANTVTVTFNTAINCTVICTGTPL